MSKTTGHVQMRGNKNANRRFNNVLKIAEKRFGLWTTAINLHSVIFLN